MAASLIVGLLATRALFAGGVLLHDHSDHGLHSHAVTFDELGEADLHAAWHHHDDRHQRDDRGEDHDNGDGDGRDDERRDSDDGGLADSLLIFVNDAAMTFVGHASSAAAIASIRHLSSTATPRSIVANSSTDPRRSSAAAWPSARPVRSGSALDTILQSSTALLL